MSNKEIVKDVFLSMYSEHSEWSRHHETQRSNVSNLIISLTGIFMALIGFDQKFDKSDIPFSILITFLGIIGLIFVYKYYVQFKFHDERVEAYKLTLNTLLDDVDLLTIEKSVNLSSKNTYPFFSKINLYKTWIFFHSLIIIYGMAFSLFLFLKS